MSKRLQTLIMAAPRRGAAMVGVLIVIVIIMLVLVLGPMGRDGDGPDSEPMIISQPRKAGGAACSANRNTMRTEITQIRINNSNVSVGDLMVQRNLRVPNCPDGGLYMFDDDANVYCTEHAAPPIHMVMSRVRPFVPTEEQLRTEIEPNPLVVADLPAEAKADRGQSSPATM